MANSVVTLVGTLTKDPAVRFTAGGMAICGFTVAVNERFKRGDEWEERTTFMDCTAFNSLAENIAASCPKGTRLVATGKLEQQEWETDEGGKRSKICLTVDEAGPALRFATAMVEKNERRDHSR